MTQQSDVHTTRQPSSVSNGRDFSELLEKVEIFRRLPSSWRQLVEDLLVAEHFDEDRIIFRAGDAATCIYIVEFGEVALYTDTIGEAIQLRAQVARGGVFGELGVLEGSQRCLSARATEATGLLRLDGAELLRLAKAHDTFARELCQVAIGYASSNQVAHAELARRKEARIRIGAKVEVRVWNREPISAVLENLSLGGACLSGVPQDWQLDEETPLAMAIDPTRALFSVHARIQWRKDDQIGLYFTHTFDDHELKIAGAVHRLTSELRAARVLEEV